MCQPVPRFWAESRYGLPPGQGAGLGEPVVWPYRDQFRGMNTTCLLSCKYLQSCSNNMFKPGKRKLTSPFWVWACPLASHRGWYHSIPNTSSGGTGAVTEGKSFSAYLQWKVFWVFLGKQHVPWNVKNVPVWISTRCCRPVQPCFALEHGQNGTDLQYISWVTYGGWMSFLPTAV